ARPRSAHNVGQSLYVAHRKLGIHGRNRLLHVRYDAKRIDHGAQEKHARSVCELGVWCVEAREVWLAVERFVDDVGDDADDRGAVLGAVEAAATPEPDALS